HDEGAPPRMRGDADRADRQPDAAADRSVGHVDAAVRLPQPADDAGDGDDAANRGQHHRLHGQQQEEAGRAGGADHGQPAVAGQDHQV
ncbi:hypothetical protein LTR94_036267, partial [Friedmanniomyces endolithicus]